MTGYPFLDNLTPDEWAVIAVGCVLVILLPSLIIAGVASFAEWLLRIIRKRQAATPETATIPTVPAASAADIDAEWADIENALRGSE